MGFDSRRLNKLTNIMAKPKRDLIFPEIILKADGIYLEKEVDEGKVLKKFSNYSSIKNQEVEIDTNRHSVHLEYLPINSNEKQEKIVEIKDITTSTNITSLVTYGLDVHEINKLNMIKHFHNQRQEADYIYSHSSLGFASNGSNPYFKHYHSIGYQKMSTYNGRINIEPKGSKEAYLNLIQNEVLGHIPLELALVFGVTSAIIGFLSLKIPMESVVVHIVGESSSGKSTSAMLSASIWGSPQARDFGTFQSWNATKNAIMDQLANNRGIVQVLDEASQYRGKDIQGVIYSLAEGSDRKRMNKDLQVKESKTWSTLILSTGEKPLIDSNMNSGIYIRLFEFAFPYWTRSHQNAKTIKEVTSGHYGHLGVEFAKKLLDLGLNNTINMYHYLSESLSKRLVSNPFSDRVADKLALFLTSAYVLHYELDIPLNLKNIEDVLIETVNPSLEVTDVGNRAYEKLINYVSSHRQKFQTEGGNNRSIEIFVGQCIGKITLNKSNQIKEISINAVEFKKIMGELGFEAVTNVLKSWKTKGYLNHEDKKLTRKRKINNVPNVSCYVIRFNGKSADDNLIDLDDL